MNSVSSPVRSARVRLALLSLAAAFLLSGCLEQLYVWSPDGRRVAVINPANRELRLADPSGQLLAPRLSNVSTVAWLRDSERLLVARRHAETSWAPLAQALGAQRAAAVTARADDAWQKLLGGTSWSGLGGVAGLFAERDPEWNLVCIYLRNRGGEALRTRLTAAEWEDVSRKTTDVHELVLARITGDEIVSGTRLYSGVDELVDVRLAPQDRAVAFVLQSSLTDTKDNALWLVALDAPAPQPVAERVAAQPDWTADGRSLVYFQAASPSGHDDLRLGTLVRREVLDASGAIRISSDQSYLAGWVFSEQTRVRCLRDGRILFNAAEISLPIAAEDYGEQREQLFALDPARQATLVRMIPRKQQDDLPKGLTFFEASPDEQQVLFGDLNGEVCVLTLASGAVEYVQQPGKKNLQGAPVWRSDGAFTYTRRATAKDGASPARAAEVILRRGEAETVLSATWPDEMVNALVSQRD